MDSPVIPVNSTRHPGRDACIASRDLPLPLPREIPDSLAPAREPRLGFRDDGWADDAGSRGE